MYRLIEVDHYVNKNILVVGGGDSAVEAAMGLANQVGNKVTLWYRGAQFSRIKDRNSMRIEDCMRSGKVEVLFETNPKVFKPESVTLDVKGSLREIPNDYVWIFAGGIPPYDFLKKIGIRFGIRVRYDRGSAASKRNSKPVFPKRLIKSLAVLLRVTMSATADLSKNLFALCSKARTQFVRALVCHQRYSQRTAPSGTATFRRHSSSFD